MNAQECSVSGQTDGRRKAFLEWTNIDLASKLSLICGSNVNYYKSVHQPIPTLLVGKGNTLSLLFSFWPNTAWKVSVFGVILVRMRENEGQNYAE